MINICVFGASSAHLHKDYLDDAYRLGELLARRGWGCVNGAGSEGLMRAVSDGVLDHGGTAVGVIPQFMVDNGWGYDRLSETIVTATMHERKEQMARLSQAVVALPGGVGTLEELLEAITWHELHLSDRPIVLLNTRGYYDRLVAMLRHAATEGLLRESTRTLWHLCPTPLHAVETLEHLLNPA